MTLTREALLVVVSAAGKPLGIAEMLDRLSLSPGARTALKRVLRELVREGELLRDGKRFRLAGLAPQGPRETEGAEAPVLFGSRMGRRGRFLVGVLRRHERGFGFVEPLQGGGDDVFLPIEEARRAFDGDLVRVEVVPGRGGRKAGRLVDVVERRRTRATGILRLKGREAWVEPVDARLGERIAVDRAPGIRDGALVKVAITRAGTARSAPAGEVAQVLGGPGDPAAEVLEAAFRQGFSDDFPDDVARQAAAATGPSAAEVRRRRDLRALRLVTIDGEDARDFDDAVHVERTARGWRLVVAIADVAHYVGPATPLDQEALRRGTSVYFPSLVLPMLPAGLSNEVCCLRPDEDRLCMVADLVFEPDGEGARCADAEVYEGVMKSAARCTYTEVAAVLSGAPVPGRDRFAPDFRLMEGLARRLIASRSRRGSIDLDLPEPKIVLGPDGKPLRIERRERNIAHRLIEEFMVAANEAVARYFEARSLPTVFRVHGEPDEEKLEAFLGLARVHGFALQAGEKIGGKALNRLLARMAGSPQQRSLHYLLLRSMMQAVYSGENVGHFGLASGSYLHFTSPIRRYPDLIVHRLLKEHWARGERALSPAEIERAEERLDAVSARCSERERAAMAAEREVAAFYEALYMLDKVGLELPGHVTGVTDFGLFVELDEWMVDGLLKAEAVGEGALLDEVRHRLVFPGGVALGLGDAVRVRVASVSVERRQIDFELAERPAGHKAAPAKRKVARGRA